MGFFSGEKTRLPLRLSHPEGPGRAGPGLAAPDTGCGSRHLLTWGVRPASCWRQAFRGRDVWFGFCDLPRLKLFSGLANGFGAARSEQEERPGGAPGRTAAPRRRCASESSASSSSSPLCDASFSAPPCGRGKPALVRRHTLEDRSALISCIENGNYAKAARIAAGASMPAAASCAEREMLGTRGPEALELGEGPGRAHPQARLAALGRPQLCSVLGPGGPALLTLFSPSLFSSEVGQNSMWISTDAAASVLEPLKVVWAKCSGYPSYPALVSRGASGAGAPSRVAVSPGPWDRRPVTTCRETHTGGVGIIDPKMPRVPGHHNGVTIPAPPLDVLKIGEHMQTKADEKLFLVLFFDNKRSCFLSLLLTRAAPLLGSLRRNGSSGPMALPSTPCRVSACVKRMSVCVCARCRVCVPLGGHPGVAWTAEGCSGTPGSDAEERR
ncbi:hypothetical protein J1605_020548 [Eschrichtius robustus]|uniref:PWWP domain-containing protein n=1 Tax=Eschrichtius robustus TaxID=9764 RepID=A0AB34HLH1_ESCRO|nr:hypothetical protein J1605_020548 [Eschrichtius robustus]